jgi:hypothetical protein
VGALGKQPRQSQGANSGVTPSSATSKWQQFVEAMSRKVIEYVATGLVAAAVAAAVSIGSMWLWFATVIELKGVVDCVADINVWLRHENFRPEIFVTGLGGSLILTELVVKKLYPDDDSYHPPTYVLYELPPNSNDKKYSKYGIKFASSSTHTQFFIPDAIQDEEKNKKIIILEDWANTGNTLHQTREELKKMNFAQIKTAVMTANPVTLNVDKRPDHVCFLSDTPTSKLPWAIAPSMHGW